MGFLVAGICFVMKWEMVDARSFAERLAAVRKSARLGLAIQGLRRGIFPIQCSLRFIYIYEKLMVAPGAFWMLPFSPIRMERMQVSRSPLWQ